LEQILTSFTTDFWEIFNKSATRGLKNRVSEAVADQFADISKMVDVGSEAQGEID